MRSLAAASFNTSAVNVELTARRRRSIPLRRADGCDDNRVATTKSHAATSSSNVVGNNEHHDHDFAQQRRGRGTTSSKMLRNGGILATTDERRSGGVARASGSGEDGGGGTLSVDPPQPGFTESYSFFNLASAEFPDDWKAPVARVSYSDSPLDLALMAWFMRKIAMTIEAPMPSNISYDEFIALCFLQMKGRDPNGQRDITLGIMKSLMPPGGDKVFRKLFPTTKWSLELNAVITKPPPPYLEVVFAWMVGPMELECTTENDLGEEMYSKVHIKKCRWLQESGCTGMCVNMCKTATQDFFCNDFGMPLTIKPNFEDKSCDFYFGLTPPPIEQDEALTFGCTAVCSTAVAPGEENTPCHKLRKYEGPPLK